MDYRDYDDGLKMPAGLRKPSGTNGNTRPASSNSGKSGSGNKTASSTGHSRPASANGNSAGSHKKPTGSNGYSRAYSEDDYEPGNYKKPASSNGYNRTVPVKAEKGKQQNRFRGLIKALVAVFCVLLAGVIAIGVYFVSRWKDDDYSSLKTNNLVILDSSGQNQNLDANAASIAGSMPASDDSTIVYNGQTYTKNKNVVNLLFLGIDTNANRKKKMKGYRSDMLMVCAVDIAAKKATLISIPRDTYTTVYKVDEDTGEIKEVVQDKINAAYAYGGGASHYSYANAMSCVEMFLERRCELKQPLDFELDIPVYLYAGIDMDGITHVASAVGGVEVTLEQSVPKVGSKGETVLLKYDNALEFLTNRKDTNGDTHRAARQQQFMIALAKKIKNMGPVDMIMSLYDDLQKYVWTNLNTDQMIDFAKVLTKVDVDSINMHMITGIGETQGSYHMLHDEQATLQLLLDVYYTKVS